MRSVAVVLPASMWAMIPMLRYSSSCSGFGTAEDVCDSTTTAICSAFFLPAVVREGLVGLRHAVDVVLLLVGAALGVRRVDDLADELVDHLLLASLPGERDEPAHGQRPRPTTGDLDRHLVVRAADAPGADLQVRRDRLDRLFEHLDRRTTRPLA